MKHFRKLSLAVLALAFVNAHAQEKMHPQHVSPAFDTMRSLAGEWNGTMDNGATLTNTIRLVSNGTAVEETFSNAHDTQMVTLYTSDGDKLAMTHYCSAGNQPRMETPPLKTGDKEFPFTMTGITNLSKPDEGHMAALTMKVEDKNHFTEAWTWNEAGKPGTTVFHFTRKGCIETKPCSLGM